MTAVQNDLEFLGLAGVALSVPEKTAIRCSLILLSQQLKQQVQFWGKVYGFHGDYLISQTVPSEFAGEIKSFYSVDGGTNWVKLDDVNEEQAEFADKIRGVFMGQPGFEYKLRKDIPPEPEKEIVLPPTEEHEENEEEEDEGEAEEKEEAEENAEAAEAEGDEDVKPLLKKRPKFQVIAMAESVRVSHFVREHDKACKVVVRGAYLKKNGKVSKNHTFVGLDVPNACKLSSYLKVFSDGDTAVNADIYGPSYTETWDFLSPVTTDRPEGVWTLKHDETMGTVTLQNLYFEGSLFYHVPGTASFGQVYFGNGERNLDLCFLLP